MLVQHCTLADPEGSQVEGSTSRAGSRTRKVTSIRCQWLRACMPQLVQTLSSPCQLTSGMLSKCLAYRLVLRWLAHWAASNTLQINTELSAPVTQDRWTPNFAIKSSAHEAGSSLPPPGTLSGCLLTHFLLYLRDSSLSASLFSPPAVAQAPCCLRRVLQGCACLQLGAK